MAPPIIRGREGDDAFDTRKPVSLEARDATSDRTMEPWLIVVIVLGVLTIASSIVFLTLYLRRKQQLKAQREKDDLLGRRNRHRRKLSEMDRLQAEEIERTTMIRKSLASRTSSWGMGSLRDSMMSEYQMDEVDHEEREPMAPERNNDWKEIEAGSEGHIATPGVDNTEMGIHPALLGQPQLQPHLSIPQPSRAPSPIRGSPPPRLIIPS
ncbi:hypothetical protein M426DRAFT_324831 [Hypoxylon sp. CI-4A]|nr:hypothetical protein M426DRAFT_324831 [Hypoxylon sp. CI-4A]